MKITEEVDEANLRIAEIWAQRSKDPSTQVGAILVSPDTRQVARGYNGFPEGVPDDPRVLSSIAGFEICNGVLCIAPLEESGLTKHDLIVHAEANAIANCHVRPVGWTLYCTHIPCKECAKTIVANGITRVVCWNARGRSDLGYDKTAAIFRAAKIQFDIRTHPEEEPSF